MIDVLLNEQERKETYIFKGLINFEYGNVVLHNTTFLNIGAVCKKSAKNCIPQHYYI